jgi:RNA polymerase sigma-70 factor (ECF subfamily)
LTRRKEFNEALLAELPDLRRYATALIGNPTLADDLVQDTIERALRQPEKLLDIQRIGSWLRRILHNRYIDEVRRGRNKEQDISELEDHLELSTRPVDRTTIRDFVKAINTLSVEHRQILLLVGLQELNYREVSEELNIPIGTVMSRLARARDRLRNAIEKDSSSHTHPSLAKAEDEP